MAFPDIYRIDILKVTAEIRYSGARLKGLAPIYIREEYSMGAHPKTTMSVREMGKLLGLKKVESYWLVHKEYFDTILVNGKMRVVIESFEHWYAGQVKYRKVNGEPPGKRLRQESYSARDIAGMLQISEMYVYELMKAAGVKPVLVDYWQRFPKEAFDEWYTHQTRYRNQADRERDAEIEENTMSMPDMARLLDVPRNIVYHILRSSPGQELLEVVIVGDRKRITKSSFERWYSSQTRYLKPEDQPKGVPRKYKSYADSLAKKKVASGRKVKEVHFSGNPDYLTVSEAALAAKTNTQTIHYWIKHNRFPALRISPTTLRIPRAEFEEYLNTISERRD
uniref:DNA binding domain, excisionase family n=1 Tax=uncultured bacterium Contig26 TaxID=1393545 RepID=W0FN91_9BACT|nr:DNA binding domain, excisionase family [uncultured bacterium Contig26]